MPLDPQVKELLDQLEAAGSPPVHELTVADVREHSTQTMQPILRRADEVVEDITLQTAVGPIRARLYRPRAQEASTVTPMLVWFHGGGWVLGGLDAADHVARQLCVDAGVIVASVEYPLAPEFPYPAGLDACTAATETLIELATELGADPLRLAIGGDSAGGNFAALVALRLRDTGISGVTFQLLVYPATDLTLSSQSMKDNGSGYLLTADVMRWCVRHYLPDGVSAADAGVSPLLRGDLAGLPPALIITAEYDPLRDEGEEFGRRLKAAGVPVTVSRFAGQVHTFFELADLLDGAQQAMKEAAAALRSALAVTQI